MTIIQITAASGGSAPQVFGLGDDQQIYYWDNIQHEWRLWTS